MCDLLDDGGLAFEQTGPHPLVLRTRSGRLVGRNLAYTEQAFHNLFWGAHPGRPGEHRGHSFAVGFLALGESHGGWCASAVRDFDAFYQERTPEPANGSILVAAQFFQAAFGHRQAGEVSDAIHGFLEGALHGCLDQTPLKLVREYTRR
ncbi:MAG: hypothetical protein DMG57_07945 [Acidobacteria bacterium]|nr:MAG: hypothetical protein DMG57_07945 [Acidobacteriota bacterium]